MKTSAQSLGISVLLIVLWGLLFSTLMWPPGTEPHILTALKNTAPYIMLIAVVLSVSAAVRRFRRTPAKQAQVNFRPPRRLMLATVLGLTILAPIAILAVMSVIDIHFSGSPFFVIGVVVPANAAAIAIVFFDQRHARKLPPTKNDE
jgi:uncharacterized membrane protein YidH (DUF202 family)